MQPFNGSKSRGAGVLIGGGLIAEGHLDGYRRVDDLQISVVVEPSATRWRHLASLVPAARIVSSLDDIDLDEFDFADICSPPSTHLDYACRTLAAGLPTLCEKPLVLDLWELEALNDAEHRSSGFIHPCHNYVFAPSMRRLLELLSLRPRINDHHTRGHFRTLRIGHARGVTEWHPDWRRDPDIGGGGILQDHGPHSIYLAMRAVGGRVLAVRCHTMSPAEGPFASTEDSAKLDLHFEGGSAVTVELDWDSDARQSAYLLDGAWGYLRLIDDRIAGQIGEISVREDIPSDFNDPRHGSWFEHVLRQFRACWSDPALAISARHEASEVVRIIAAAYHSADLGGSLLERAEWPTDTTTRHTPTG